MILALKDQNLLSSVGVTCKEDKMKRLLLLLICLGLAGFKSTQADVIYVSGDVSGTWSADTVLVTGEVRVPPDSTLIIEPGVSVLFQVYCKFIVDTNATLLAVGTETDSILFDEFYPDTSWHGIRFLGASDSSQLAYCHLTHGSATGGYSDNHGGAIYCSNSSPTISRNTISSNSANYDGGGIYCYSSSPFIRSNTISGNSADGGGGIYCYYYSNPTISNNTICENTASYSGGGIKCNLVSNPIISGNTISGNSAYYGGGIHCYYYSNPTISNNTICENTASDRGGGIYCNWESTNPIISGNTISSNSANYGGGIYCYYYSNPSISGNTISGNSADNGGGIYCHWHSDPTIIGNTISGNSTNYGSGIYCDWKSDPIISGNTISGNSANYGGGIYCSSHSDPTIIGNTISENSANSRGGGIFCYRSSPSISGNTISSNSAFSGGGIWCNYNSNPTLLNCILWGDNPQEIYLYSGSIVQATYCDIQGGWHGTGNIDADPLFVDPTLGDYNLQWPSPCIDSGNPYWVYNDPDGTRADMGAYYYDYSALSVDLSLVPFQIPVQIPASGGSFDYYLFVTNAGADSLPVDLWSEAMLPDSSFRGPIVGPVRATLETGTTGWVRNQNVPGSAPPGTYSYNAYAGIQPNVILANDSFPVEKLLIGDGPWVNDWNWSQELMGLIDQGQMTPSPYLPADFILYPCHPNPFNPLTTISFGLPEASRVALVVYDLQGRKVNELVNGARNAGVYEVTFNGSNFASGIYLYRFEAGDFSATGEMVLLK